MNTEDKEMHPEKLSNNKNDFNWNRKPYKPMFDPDMEEKKRADLARERDLVLAQIEYREDTDPGYNRPEWISIDEKSTRRKDGVTILTEGERYLGQNEKLFEKDVERFFPHPRDH